jgi:hypothetical protein
MVGMSFFSDNRKGRIRVEPDEMAIMRFSDGFSGRKQFFTP